MEYQYDLTGLKTANTSFSEQPARHFRRYLITATIQLLQEILQQRFTYFDTVCDRRLRSIKPLPSKATSYPGSLSTPGAAEKTLAGAGHVTIQNFIA